MRLTTRLQRLETTGAGQLITEADREAAIERYTAVEHAVGHLFPDAITPAEYRALIETSRDPSQQRMLACWLPGDEDL